ncbi:hypothetical protein CTRI78_v005870 [Colletotrichum trifolii]|uniref:Nephrocystin 3-like N-terminal domain-containing protein n=1 Tax=Colletotrichum trifolii TaxID=5466 RepID=A0A4R8RDP7_COLTR|nr:hypothetical protein CTRI78_v005870 [Colletotrichum trifolii]
MLSKFLGSLKRSIEADDEPERRIRALPATSEVERLSLELQSHNGSLLSTQNPIARGINAVASIAYNQLGSTYTAPVTAESGSNVHLGNVTNIYNGGCAHDLSTEDDEDEKTLRGRCQLGKPGSGKSILVKTAFQRSLAGDALEKQLTLGFFFNARDVVPLGRSSQGFFRSILSQLLERLQPTSEVVDIVKQLPSPRDGECDVHMLRHTVTQLLNCIRGQRTVLFLDALDECRNDQDDPDAIDILDFINGLSDTAQRGRHPLHDLFGTLLDNAARKRCDESLALFHLTQVAVRPLTLSEVRSALGRLSSSGNLDGMHRAGELPAFAESDSLLREEISKELERLRVDEELQFADRIHALSGGLLEVWSSSPTSPVRHEKPSRGCHQTLLAALRQHKAVAIYLRRQGQANTSSKTESLNVLQVAKWSSPRSPDHHQDVDMNHPGQPVAAVAFTAMVAVLLVLLVRLLQARPTHQPVQSNTNRRTAKDMTFRIDHVPGETSTTTLETNLHSLGTKHSLELRETLSTLRVCSLARRDARFACATVIFRTRLADMELLTELQSLFKAGGFRHRCDCTFYGITPLYENVSATSTTCE